MKQAEAAQARADHVSAMQIAEMKQVQLEKVRAEQLVTRSTDEIKQANAAKFRADQATASMERELEQATAEKTRAEQVAAKAVDELKNEDSSEGTMKFILVSLSIFTLLLVAVVAFLTKKLSNMKPSLAEPLLEEAAVEPEPPTPKPFEGRWRKEDGTVVQIDGDKLVHDDGRQETVTDLESQP